MTKESKLKKYTWKPPEEEKKHWYIGKKGNKEKQEGRIPPGSQRKLVKSSCDFNASMDFKEDTLGYNTDSYWKSRVEGDKVVITIN